VHRPHDGRALSQRFFLRRQLRQTLEDFAAACWWGEEAADILGGGVGRKAGEPGGVDKSVGRGDGKTNTPFTGVPWWRDRRKEKGFRRWICKMGMW
jgi:hypothetical protein